MYIYTSFFFDRKILKNKVRKEANEIKKKQRQTMIIRRREQQQQQEKKKSLTRFVLKIGSQFVDSQNHLYGFTQTSSCLEQLETISITGVHRFV